MNIIIKYIFLLFIVLVHQNLTAQTFTKNIGYPSVNDGATSIASSPEGFYISGYTDDYSYITNIDFQGNLLWTEYLNFTEALDFVTHINVIDDKILGCGFGDDESGYLKEFYFKFDIATKSFDWVKRTSEILKPATIHQLPNGNYLMTGDVTGYNKFSVFLMELNPQNGKMIKYNKCEFSGNESASTSLIHNDAIYIGGRYALEKKLDKYRGAISKFDLNFKEQWSKYYLNKKERFLKNYLSKILVDQENLVSLFLTNNHGINNYFTLSLAKQSLDGEMIWAYEYSLKDYENLSVRDLKSVEDGYLIYGFTRSPNENVFLLKTDKEGNALWAKTYGGRFNDNLQLSQGNFFEVKDDYIYLIGQSINLNSENDYDSFLMKLNKEGSSDQECWSRDVKVKTKQYLDLVQGEIFLSQKDTSYPNYNVGYKKLKKIPTSEDSYYCYPKLAKNDLDTVFAEKSIWIDFLKNDVIPKDEVVTFKLISSPLYGEAKIESRKIIYSANTLNQCVLDSFSYILSSKMNSDTAIVYVRSINNNELNIALKDTILPKDSKLELNATYEDATYLWNTGSNTATINVTKPGIYSVLIMHNKCLYNKEIEVIENPYSFEEIAATNISFLLDVSISMNRANRLPVMKTALYNILNFMRNEDMLSIVNYSDNAEIIFDGIRATEIDKIKSKIDSLNSAGKSNIKEGLKLSLQTIKNNFTKDGNNRIIFTTDGDISNENRKDLIEYMKKNFPKDTYFSIFLFNDATLFKSQMQTVADEVGGSLYVITPENVEEILLKEIRAVRK